VQNCFCQATCFFSYIRQSIKIGGLIPSILAEGYALFDGEENFHTL